MISDRGKFFDTIRSKSQNPDKPALHLASGEILTYGELLLLTEQADAAFQQIPIQPHERIALIGNNNPVFVPLLLAALENATCVPFDPEFTLDQYQDHFQLLNIDYLLCDKYQTTAMEAAARLGTGIILFNPDDEASPRTLQFDLMHRSSRPSDQPFRNSQTAFVFTTSGTTSTPKIVPKLYQDSFQAFQDDARYMGFNEESRLLFTVPLCRAITVQYLLRILMTNGSFIYTDGMHPKRITDLLQGYPVHYMYLPTAGLFALYEYVLKHPITVTWTNPLHVFSFGAPLPHHIKHQLERQLNAQLHDFYGMTEIGSAASDFRASLGYKAGSIGCATTLEIRIVDDEIVVRGPGVFRGYENNPEANRDSFVDGWFRTGDMGYIDQDGYVFITGRIREMINRGGEKVSPHEVEEAIKSLGHIRDASVFPFPNKQGSDDVGAAIVLEEGYSLSLRELRFALKDRIRPYKLPTIMYTVSEMPTSQAGKVQRNQLYQHLQELNLVPETMVKSVAVTESDLTSTQQIIRDIWQDILEQPAISIDDDFFDLGGDSLDAAEILAATETSFQKVIPISEFFLRSTIRQLADLVDQTDQAETFKHIVPIKPRGDKAPLFLIHALSGEVVTYQHIAKHIDPHRPVYGLNLNYGKEQWDTSITIHEIARAYINEIQAFQPEGPYRLGGFSMGGAIALEAARLLQQEGKDAVVIMLDTASREATQRKPSTVRVVRDLVRNKLKRVKNIPAAQIPGLVLGKIKPFVKETAFKLDLQSTYDPEELNQRLQRKYGDKQSEIQQNMFLLRHIYLKHQPSFFPGKVYFFNAARRRDSAPDYWRPLAEQMVVIQKNFHHMDFVEARHAADTAHEIDQILARHEA